MMKEQELIKTLNNLFGKKRSLLRQSLREVIDNLGMWKRIGRELRKKTSQPVEVNIGLFDETLTDIKKPKFDMFWIGDASYTYGIVLNSGIKRGLDFDKRLVIRCGGTAYLCKIWASLLLPYYTIDTYSYTYDTNLNQLEFRPYVINSVRGKKLISKIREVLKENGFSRINKRLANEKVPKAITDCNPNGGATIFDCLFSDTERYHEDTVLCSDKPLPGTYPGSKVSWHERFDRNGNVKHRDIWIEFSSGDWVTVYLDKMSRIIKLKVTRKLPKGKYDKMFLDVEKRIQRMKRDKRKDSK